MIYPKISSHSLCVGSTLKSSRWIILTGVYIILGNGTLANAKITPPSPTASTLVVPEATVSGAARVGKIPQDILKLRDPFKRMAVANPRVTPQSDLEVIPISDFKLMGVLIGKGLEKMRAMLQGPNGKTYFVSESSRIGIRRGFIKKITSKGLVVRERINNVLGEEQSVDTEIKLDNDSEKKLGLNW